MAEKFDGGEGGQGLTPQPPTQEPMGAVVGKASAPGPAPGPVPPPAGVPQTVPKASAGKPGGDPGAGNTSKPADVEQPDSPDANAEAEDPSSTTSEVAERRDSKALAEGDRAGEDGPGSDDGGALGAKGEPTLGPGGTAMMPVGGHGDSEGTGQTAAKAAGVGAAVPAVATANQLLVIMAFLNYLKNLVMGAIAVAQNFINTILATIAGVGKSVMGFVGFVGNAVSGVVGGSALIAGATTVGGGVIGAGVIASLVIGSLTAGGARADVVLVDCGPSTRTAVEKVDQSGDATGVQGKTLANAKTIYGVLSAWGMPAENIAGILGNWDAESAVDPTSVQNNFSAPQQMTDEKKSQATNTDNGIGLGQWTFGRNSNLRGYADRIGQDWWTVETQLGFMISADEGGNADIVKGMISTSKGSPGAAALFFHDEWERSADTEAMAARRAEKANKWMGMFGGWTKNESLAASILAQSGSTINHANKDRVEKVQSNCKSEKKKAGVLKTGGLTLEEATELMATYRSEGEAFLQARYPGGSGPGDCGHGKADNCVGFSIYFANKFTSMQSYARGNGIDTARSVADVMGKQTSKTPTPYSIASGPGSGAEGHTFVVLGIQGDQAVIGEANCGTNHKGTQARLMSLSELTNGSYVFVDVSDSLLPGVSLA